MVVTAASAGCVPLPERYPKCYSFPFLKDFLRKTFLMAALSRPNDTLQGLTGWLVGIANDSPEASIEKYLLDRKASIRDAYWHYLVSVGQLENIC